MTEAEVLEVAHNTATSWEPEPDGQGFEFTDIGNAERLVHRHGQNLRYVAGANAWFIFDGTRWVRDDRLEIENLAVDTVQAIPHEIRPDYDDDEKKAVIKWYKASSADARVTAMVRRARPLLPADRQDFDRDDWVLNVLNGTIDLRTGELRPHDRDDFLAQLAPVEYPGLNAKAPRWKRFIREIYGGDEELIDWMHRSLGYAITGDMSEELYWLPWGRGRNGKGLQLRTVRNILGDYAGQAAFSVFEKGQKGIRDDLADLAGKRFVISGETGDSARLDMQVLKAITGRDALKARNLYERFQEFRPKCKIFLAVNSKPGISDFTDSSWERTRLVPHVTQFLAGVNQDKHLEDKLRAEWPGILAWLVRGCLAYQERGLTPAPDSVLAEVRQYREEQDPIGRFIAEVLTVDEGLQISASSAYKTYAQWADENLSPRERLSSRKFYEVMGTQFRSKKPHNVRTYHGVGVPGIRLGK